MKFGEYPQGRKAKREDDEIEYYEDTHNERGEYLASDLLKYSLTDTMKSNSSKPLPSAKDNIAMRSYQNVLVYEPRTPEDVQGLIDFLKRREPAIINLDNVDVDTAQRILDFVSGAIYALNGSVHRINSNIFLLSPEGVEITVQNEL